MDATGFFTIRQKWALWLTHDIEAKLDDFERKFPKLAGEAAALDDYGEHGSRQTSVKSVIADLRGLLATEELTSLRRSMDLALG